MTDALTLDAGLTKRGSMSRFMGLPRITRQALGVVWAAAPKVFAATVVLQILNSAMLVVQLFAFRALLGKLLVAHQSTKIAELVPIAAVVIAAFAVSAVVTASGSGLQHLLSEMVARYAMGRVLEAASVTDLVEFESPEMHDRLQRALLNAGSRPTQMTGGLINVLSALMGSIGVGIVLLFLSPLLLGLCVLGAVPIWIFGVNSSKSLYQFAFRQTAPDRERLYLQVLLTSRDWAKEVRAYLLGPTMLQRWNNLYGLRLDDLRGVLKGRVARGIAGVLLGSIVLGAALGTLLWLLLHGKVALASAATAAGALVLLSRQLTTLAGGGASLYESALFMRDFTSFTPVGQAGETKEVEAPRSRRRRGAHSALPSQEEFVELVVDHVSFAYPTSERVLNDVTLRVGAGEVIALVGENGSGKSTLAKLMAGLYQATDGAIYWNRHDYASTDLDDVRTQMAVLFQDFIKFQMSVQENIALGRPKAYPDRELIRRAAEVSGAASIIDELPNGMHTQLGPQFVGGTELSGGQWQRIALARAAYRDAPVVILDEPTAALDPIAEAALFDRTRSVFENKAVVLISHRFGSVRRADRIYVLDKGSIVEQGDHDYLLGLNGLYARMYNLQRASLIGADEEISSFS